MDTTMLLACLPAALPFHPGQHLLLLLKLRRSNADGAAGAGGRGCPHRGADPPSLRPRARILLRGDLPASPGTPMASFRANRVDYVFGLARNDRLEKAIVPELITATIDSIRTGKTTRRASRTSTTPPWAVGAANAGSQLGKAEVTGGEANPRFVVTSLKRSEAGARHLYEEDLLRAGRYGEPHQGVPARPVRRPHLDGNDHAGQPALRLWFASMAYMLLCSGIAPYRPGAHPVRRGHLRHDPAETAEAGRLGQFVGVRRIKIAMACACPWQGRVRIGPCPDLRSTLRRLTRTRQSMSTMLSPNAAEFAAGAEQLAGIPTFPVVTPDGASI